ncbi:MAG: ATP-binding protein [Oligoflexia bacterium]|nr:ATP-binding protein [Oligoflexia bacterium]
MNSATNTAINSHKFVINNIELNNISETVTLISSKAKTIYPPFIRGGDMELIIEEILVNICNYAYPMIDSHRQVEISLDFDEKTKSFFLKIVDFGLDFNPLLKEEPNLELDLEDRPIGGLGIHLVKKLASKVEYSRKNYQNILSLEIHST